MSYKLDIKDKKILYELEKDARQSNRVIGKKVGVKPDLVRYRINRLVENKVIDNFLTFVNFSKLGYTDFGVFINTKRLTKQKEEDFIAQIKKNENVSYFSKVGGGYDYIVGILAKDVLHFNDILSKIISKYEGNISKKEISIRMKLFHFSKDYLVDKKSLGGNLPSFGGSVNKPKMDELNNKIIKLIATNARKNIIELSTKLKVPPSTIALRLKKLKEEGIIEGYFTWINPSRCGYDSYNVMLNFSNMDKKVENKFYSFCKSNQHISWLIKTIGKWDYEVGVEVPNKEKFQELLSEIKEKFSEHIINLEFVIIFETMKYNLYPFKST